MQIFSKQIFRISYQLMILVIALFLLPGCSSPVQRISKTASGHPEVLISSVGVEAVKSRLIERVLTAGFRIESETPSQIVVSKELSGMHESVMRLAIANAHSTPVRAETVFTIIKSEVGVKIFARTNAMSTMPMGQVRRAEMNDTNTFNGFQTSLEKLRDSFITNPSVIDANI